MSDEQEDALNLLSMQVVLPLDSHQCARRNCPECGLDFKEAAADADLSGVLAEPIGVFEKHSKPKAHGGDSRTWCPYCGHEAVAQDFLHDEHADYLQRVMMRQFVEPMFAKMIDDAFGNFTNTKSVQLTLTNGVRTARPLLGPEPTDMVPIRCLKCRELFKVLETWRGDVRCPECGTTLRPI